MAICIVGIFLSMWPLFKLSWCKSEELIYLHEGQKGLIKVAYSTLAFYIIAVIIFSISFSPPPMPTWMLYRSAIFILYGAIHTFICLLHYYMGMVDRLSVHSNREKHGFSCIKTIILSVIICILAMAAFIMLLLENKGVASYDDEDDLKFERRHSVSQMRNMMLSLNIGCLLLNTFLICNLSKMVTRANREKGSTTCTHYIALVINVVAFLLLIGMIVSLYFPTQVDVYRYLQDSYFGIQMLVQIALLQAAILG